MTVLQILVYLSGQTPRKRGMSNEKNPMWKGDKVGYNSLHEWVRSHLPKPSLCPSCKIKPPLEVANISGKYLRDLSDWQWSCRRCHMLSDGRMKNLKRRSKGRQTIRHDDTSDDSDTSLL